MPVGVAGAVVRIEHGAGEDHHVREHRPDEPHDDDVAEPSAVAEPLRLRERAEQAHPHRDAEAEERRVLERVDGVVAQRRLIQRGQMPDVEVDRPARDRDHRVREYAQPSDRLDPQQRREQWSREPEDDQQRREIADQQVLDHVGHEQLVGELVDRRAERDCEHDQAGRVAPLAPARDRPAVARERAHARVVREPVEQDQDRQPDAAERPDGREGERQGAHGHQRSTYGVTRPTRAPG